MAPSIEDILLARAQQKEEERLSPEASAIIGACLLYTSPSPRD